MPKVEIPLVGPSATNRERPLSAQATKNMWPEINPEARNVVSLHNTAGIKTFATLSGVDRGMHDFNNLMYAVNAQTLYSIDADGVNTALGTIAGSDRVVMANDSTQLIITTGATPYRYTVAGGVEEITDPDLVNPRWVTYINSQFVFDQNNGVFGEFVTSSIDPGLSIDALDFANAESHPDAIVRGITFRSLVYFFGTHSVEPWQNTGVGNPPFALLRGGVQPYGLAGIHGVVATPEYMYFLDAKRIPRRSSGLDFINIGTPPIGVEFAKYSKIDDVVVFDYTQDNQQFIAFTFPTANRTWVFHEPSASWFQLTSGIGNDRHRMSSMIRMYGLNYCADHTNGLIYEYSADIYSDNGEPIINERTCAEIHGGLFGAPGAKLFFDEVEFIIAAGQTEVAGTGPGAQPQPAGDPVALELVYVLNKALYSGDTAQIDYISMDYESDASASIAQTRDYDAAYVTRIKIISDGEFILINSGSSPVNFSVLEYDGAGGFNELFDDSISRTNPLPDPPETEDVDYLSYLYGGTGFFITDQAFQTSTSPPFGNHDSADSLSTGTWSNSGVNNLTNDIIVEYDQDTEDDTEHVVDYFMDFRSLPYSGYGDLFAGQWQVGDSASDPKELRSFRYDGAYNEGVTFIGTSSIATPEFSGFHAWDRDTGGIIVIQVHSTYDYNFQFKALDYSTGVFTDDGSDSIADKINCAAFYKGFLIVHQFGYGAFDAGIYSYSWDGATLTEVDFTAPASFGTPVVASVDPYSDFIWFTGLGAYIGGAIEILDDGTFGRMNQGYPIENGRGTMFGDEPGHMYFLPAPLGDEPPYVPPSYPDAPTDDRVEIVDPFWENTGNWINLSALTNTTFEAMFGVAIELADFNDVFAVNKAALVNTDDTGNRLQIQHSIDCTDAALYVVDSDGDVVDSMIYAGVATGDSVLVPTGANYYVVLTSDTGNAQVRKWDTTQVSTVGSVSWLSFFGRPFESPYSYAFKVIPSDGISIAFTVPITSDSVRVYFSTVGNTTVSSTRTGSVNQTVGDYTSEPTHTWGSGQSIIGGINYPGQDIDLIPGETYFFNVRNNSPLSSNNLIDIKCWYVDR